MNGRAGESRGPSSYSTKLTPRSMEPDIGQESFGDIPMLAVSEARIAEKAPSALRVLEANNGMDLAEMLGLVFIESPPMVWRCEKCGRDDFKGHKGLSNHDRACRKSVLI